MQTKRGLGRLDVVERGRDQFPALAPGMVDQHPALGIVRRFEPIDGGLAAHHRETEDALGNGAAGDHAFAVGLAVDENFAIEREAQ